MLLGEEIMPTDQNDHDLLITLNAKMELVLSSLGTLTGKVSILENRDGRDSERMSAIQKDIADSLRNAGEVPALKVKIEDMEDRVDKLESKSNTWSILNSLGVAVVAILAWIFGR